MFYIKEKLLDELFYIAKKVASDHNAEVAFLLFMQQKGRDYEIVDYEIPPQENKANALETEVIGEKYDEMLNDILDNPKDPRNKMTLAWCHSHANANVFISGTDEECIQRFRKANFNWILNIVINANEDLYAQIDMFHPVNLSEKVKINITREIPNMKALDKRIDERVKIITSPFQRTFDYGLGSSYEEEQIDLFNYSCYGKKASLPKEESKKDIEKEQELYTKEVEETFSDTTGNLTDSSFLSVTKACFDPRQLEYIAGLLYDRRLLALEEDGGNLRKAMKDDSLISEIVGIVDKINEKKAQKWRLKIDLINAINVHQSQHGLCYLDDIESKKFNEITKKCRRRK
jgi:proteasome lid subunit RPN8/RPN11